VASGQREKGGGPDWAAGRRGGDGLGQQKKRGEGNRPGREEPREEGLVFILFQKYVSSLIIKLVLKTTYKPHQNKCSFNSNLINI
jgi:hypothetical protein